jgi:hypothetical protein
MSEITIDKRFCGPPHSANGGYLAGRLAAHVPSHCVRVRLVRPPPLEHALRVADAQQQGSAESLARWELLDDRAIEAQRLVAWAEPASLTTGEVRAIDYESAVAASEDFPGWHAHPFPGCFVCGTQRARDDGLRIFAGPLDEGRVAAPWTPSKSLGDATGHVRPEFVWSALDCPGAIAASWDGSPLFLGEITVKLICPVRVDQPCTVSGWRLLAQDRRFEVATALFGSDGRLCAISHAWWIRPKLLD